MKVTNNTSGTVLTANLTPAVLQWLQLSFNKHYRDLFHHF